MDLKEIYKNSNAYLSGHFLLSSGNHSEFYLQSAKVLEDPSLAGRLATELFNIIKSSKISFDSICSPALGGIIAGYELARVANKRFIFTERTQNIMSLRRGFEIKQGEKFIICEDIITTGGSALESAEIIESLGAEVVGFASLANRGFCSVWGEKNSAKQSCKLPIDKPLFSLGNFEFQIYRPNECPLCKAGSTAIKPGSRAN